MKRSGSLVATVTATAVLAALVLAVPGCARPAAPPAPAPSSVCNRPGIPVTVFVGYNQVTNQAVTANKTVYLCEGKDWVEWVSSEGSVSDDIRWKSGSPFDERPRHDGKVLKSKPPKKGLAGKVFEYEVDLVLGNGTKVRVDPKIEIME